jgi:hypothetical protein
MHRETAKNPDQPANAGLVQITGPCLFFKAGSSIKIGVAAASKDKTLKDALKRRMKQVQSANHEPIELLGAILFPESSGEMPTFLAETRERELHNRFASSLRFKQHTVGAEWFTSTDDLLGYINENAQTPEALGLPRVIAITATLKS